MDSDREQQLETVNVRLSDEILSMLDQLVSRGIFSSRSEAIREFVREHVFEQRPRTATASSESRFQQQSRTKQASPAQRSQRGSNHG